MKAKPSTRISDGQEPSFHHDRNQKFRSLGISTAGLGSDLPVPAQNALVTIGFHHNQRTLGPKRVKTELLAIGNPWSGLGFHGILGRDRHIRAKPSGKNS